MEATTTGAGLRREIGFYGLLAFSVGINVGAGLFVLVNVAGALAGPAVIISMLIAATPAMLALIPYTMLTRGYSTTSATYRYAQLFNPDFGLIAVAVVVVAVAVGGLPLFALAAGDYLEELVPIPALITAVVALVTFYLVNLAGLRFTVITQVVLMFALIAALILYIALGLGSVDGANLTPFVPEGPIAMLAAGGLLFGLMAGGLFIVDVGDEVIDPAAMYRRVLPLGMVIVLVLYLLIVLVTVGAVPFAALEEETLVVAAEAFMGGVPLAFFIVGGALVASVTTLNVTFTLVSRAILAVSRDGFLPSVLGRVNVRTGCPHWALTFAFTLALATVLVRPSTQFLGSALNLGLVLAISAVALSASRVPDTHPEIYEPSRATLPVGVLRAACYTVIGFNSFIALLLTAATPAATATLAAAVFIAFAYRRWQTGGKEQAASHSGSGRSAP